MVVTPSFQLRIAHRLKHWIVYFLNFEKKTLWVSAIRGSRHVWQGKLKRPSLPSGIKRRMWNIRRRWKVGRTQFRMWDIRRRWNIGQTEFRMFSWQRTLKLQSFGSSCFWAFHCFAMDSKELSSILDCFGDQITNKNTKTYTKWLEMIERSLIC